jgi:hypothetical protein
MTEAGRQHAGSGPRCTVIRDRIEERRLTIFRSRMQGS